jgi:hypothetical protein
MYVLCSYSQFLFSSDFVTDKNRDQLMVSVKNYNNNLCVMAKWGGIRFSRPY